MLEVAATKKRSVRRPAVAILTTALLVAATFGPGCSEGDKFTDPGNPPVVSTLVTTDGSEPETYFKYGATVHFELRLTNTTESRLTVTLMTPPCVFKVDGAEGEVWSEPEPSDSPGWFFVRLSARETETITTTWRQVDGDGEWVGHGQYAVSVRIRESLVNDSNFTTPSPARFSIGP